MKMVVLDVVVWVRGLVRLGLFAQVGIGVGVGVLDEALEPGQLGQRGSQVVIE